MEKTWIDRSLTSTLPNTTQRPSIAVHIITFRIPLSSPSTARHPVSKLGRLSSVTWLGHISREAEKNSSLSSCFLALKSAHIRDKLFVKISGCARARMARKWPSRFLSVLLHYTLVFVTFAGKRPFWEEEMMVLIMHWRKSWGVEINGFHLENNAVGQTLRLGHPSFVPLNDCDASANASLPTFIFSGWRNHAS